MLGSISRQLCDTTMPWYNDSSKSVLRHRCRQVGVLAAGIPPKFRKVLDPSGQFCRAQLLPRSLGMSLMTKERA